MIKNLRSSISQISIALIAQIAWIVIVALGGALLAFVFGTTNIEKILDRRIDMPAWTLMVAAILALIYGLVLRAITRKSSAVHGRADATAANLTLLQQRQKVTANERIVRSTRLGRWVYGEVLPSRSSFRDELNAMVREEGCDLRRIWNITSLDDVRRIRQVLEQYQGNRNSSIRSYFNLPDHVLPELLVVEGCGSTISFPSTRSPHELDWSVQFTRKDLVAVIRDYFDVLWDRAARLLDAGEVTEEGWRVLDEVETRLREQTTTN